VWRRQAEGRTFTFHLAGINNQNFIMRDEETGSYWQQVTGTAIAGPLRGARLERVSMDELSFALWKQESPNGTVLAPVANYARHYEKKDWESEMAKARTVVDVAGTGLPAREIVIGISLAGNDRAYPLEKIIQQSPVQDRMGSVPLLLLAGPDGKSVRAFVSRIPAQSAAAEFFRTSAANAAELMDSVSGSRWNFQGCAISGPEEGKCLEPVSYLKDYWFDWHNYHPATTVYSR
jgi:hypothetical protein